MSMVAKVSANWFPKEERVVATMTSIVFGLIGNSIAFLLPIFFVDS